MPLKNSTILDLFAERRKLGFTFFNPQMFLVCIRPGKSQEYTLVSHYGFLKRVVCGKFLQKTQKLRRDTGTLIRGLSARTNRFYPALSILSTPWRAQSERRELLTRMLCPKAGKAEVSWSLQRRRVGLVYLGSVLGAFTCRENLSGRTCLHNRIWEPALQGCSASVPRLTPGSGVNQETVASSARARKGKWAGCRG